MSYTKEKRTCNAFGPRAKGLTVLEQDKLSLVYNKYKSLVEPQPGQIKLNFVFSHGTGMNKLVWHHHIDGLYKKSQLPGLKFFVDACVLVDAVSHGDSALVNQGKLGVIYRWDEGGKDLLAVMHHENSFGDFYNNSTSRNIVVGHSLGGNAAVMAGFYEPNFVDCVVPVEAVLFSDDAMRPRFVKIFRKIAGLLIDEFDTAEEFQGFLDFSFYNTMDKQVVKDFAGDELYSVLEDDGEIKWKTKSLKHAQMASYLGSAYSLTFTMLAIQAYRTAVCHVIGKQATWNPPESITWVRSHLPPGTLVKSADIDGSHLVHGDNPEGMIQLLVELAGDRTVSAEKQLAGRVQDKFGNDRGKIIADANAQLEGATLPELESKL